MGHAIRYVIPNDGMSFPIRRISSRPGDTNRSHRPNNFIRYQQGALCIPL